MPPSDLGQLQIADRLLHFELARNGSFSLRPQDRCLESSIPEPYLWTDLGPGTSSVTETADGDRLLALATSGARTQLVYGLSAGDQYTLTFRACSSLEGHAGRVTLEFLDAAGAPVGAPVRTQLAQSTWRSVTRQGIVPDAPCAAA